MGEVVGATVPHACLDVLFGGQQRRSEKESGIPSSCGGWERKWGETTRSMFACT